MRGGKEEKDSRQESSTCKKNPQQEKIKQLDSMTERKITDPGRKDC